MKGHNKTAKRRFHWNDDKLDNEMNMYINLRNGWTSSTSHALNKVQLTTSVVVQSLRICQSFKGVNSHFRRLKFKFASLKSVGIIPLARDQTYSSASWISSVRISAAISDFPVLCNMPPTIWSPHPTPLRFVNTFKRRFLAKKINRRKFYWIMPNQNMSWKSLSS